MARLVSIVIPAYNAEQWLADTLRSCLAQTWPRIEVIVVDDGSADRTLEVARRFERATVKVVTQPNQGAAAARNRGLDLAQGSFIQWLDADDLLHPQKIANQMHVAEEIADPRYVLSGAFGTFYYRPERATFARTSLWRDLGPVEYFLTRFRENLWFQTDVWLVSRELTEAAGPWSDFDSPDDDGEYFCRIVSRSRGTRFVEQARSYYRLGISGSLHARRSSKALTALFESKAKCIRYLLALEDSPRTRAASIRLLQDWMPYFHPEHREIVARADALARELGGELAMPLLNWKYRAVESLLGYPQATKISRALPAFRTRIASRWDKFLSQMPGQQKLRQTGQS